MSVIDTVRPISSFGDGTTAVPSGTIHGVTSDDNDATWASFSGDPDDGAGFSVIFGSHTPPANHERHQLRVRARVKSNAGVLEYNAGFLRISTFEFDFWSSPVTTTLTTFTYPWLQNPGWGLASASALNDLRLTSISNVGAPGSLMQVVALYVDIDCRTAPVFTPDVLDAAGVSQSGGTVTDTNRPTLVFGGVSYDGLPDLDWSVTVGSQTFSGSGTPPTSLQTNALVSGVYEAEFTVRSTIRGVDPFSNTETVTFTVDYDIPTPPPPANLTATEVDGGVQLCWEDPGGQPWDDDFVYAEVLRTSCGDEDELGLNLPGEVGAYAWTADKAALDITGDIDLAIELVHRSWRPPIASALLTKHTTVGDQRSYSLALQSSGAIELSWSTAGTTPSRFLVLSDPVPFGEARRAVRATLDVNDGLGNHVITFYTADSIDGPWTQLGATVTQVGTTSIFSGTANLEVGSFSGGASFMLEGVVRRAQVRSGIGGTLVADPNFVDTLFGQTELVDSVGNLWTVAGAAELQDVPRERIAVIENGLTACYTDYTVPTTDVSDGCDPAPCPVSYVVRYVGTVSSSVSLPSNVPDGFILGWPSTAASIPSGWTRVTALDERFPRGSAAAVSGATGGAASHVHTTPGHTHSIANHTHSVGGSTGTSNSSTTSARFDGASQTQADQPHSHARAANTGSGGSATSSSTAPATDSGSNLPAYRDVIWIESDGTPTAFTAGTLAFSAEDVSGWTDDAASGSRYLRGALAAGNGGGTGGASVHAHTVASHTHTGGSHSHSLGNTGLSNPLSSIEAGSGSSTPEWLPRHTHPQTVGSSSTGSLNSAGGGTTSAPSSEPPNRRLRVLTNLAGGLQTRMIGLFRGDSASLPATMVRCDGTSGTPDMRDWFARERGADSVGSTGGASTHSHTNVAHGHTIPGHTHTTAVGVSATASFERPTFGDLGDSPTTTHTHSSGSTGSTSPTIGTTGAGTTNTVDNTPPYEDVHFVRLEGVSTVTGVAVPQVTSSQFAEVTIDAPDALSDRLATESGVVEICPASSYDLPRIQVRATPLAGGTPQVSTTTHGRHRRLSFPVDDSDVTAIETILGMSFVWYAPLTEDAAWYAPSGWSVRPQVPGTKLVTVTLVRADPPALEDPEDLL